MGYWGVINPTLTKGNLIMEPVFMTMVSNEGTTLKKHLQGRGF